MQTLNALDRRIFERFSARFPAKLQHTRDDYGANMYLRDASGMGVRISTKEQLYIHDSVTLEVELASGNPPMIIKGEVVWIRNKAPQLWDVGIQFHKIDFMSMWRLYELVD
jgi:Tfp pilus assembly protein PilZ